MLHYLLNIFTFDDTSRNVGQCPRSKSRPRQLLKLELLDLRKGSNLKLE